MTNEFQTFFDKPYHEIIRTINHYISDNTSIIDLGCNNGNLEDEIERNKSGCTIYGVDSNKEALETIKNKNYKKIMVQTFVQDANEFFLTTTLSGIDTILINATIHEINDPKNQREYLARFFQTAWKILHKGGKIIVWDYYYHDNVSEEEFQRYLEYQRKSINHADSREKFILPDIIKSEAIENWYTLVYENELRAVKEIDRRYYCFVFEKK